MVILYEKSLARFCICIEGRVPRLLVGCVMVGGPQKNTGTVSYAYVNLLVRTEYR